MLLQRMLNKDFSLVVVMIVVIKPIASVNTSLKPAAVTLKVFVRMRSSEIHHHTLVTLMPLSYFLKILDLFDLFS